MASVKQKIVSALCQHLSLDPNSFLTDLDRDLKSLCTKILSTSETGNACVNNSELIKWVGFTAGLLEKSNATVKDLNELNEDLIVKSVLLGNGFTPSPADVIVFSAVHSFLIGASSSDRENLPHLFRWAKYIQSKEEFGQLFEKILFEDVPLPEFVKNAKKVEDSNTKKTGQEEAKVAGTSELNSKTKKNSDAKKKAEGNEPTTEKKKPPPKETDNKKPPEKEVDKKKVPEKQSDQKDEDVSVSLLKIQIGCIRKAWKHPSADSLLVEEIDIGQEKCRQVVSGLAKYCSPEELLNRRVVLITNVKPGKLRDVVSEGLVLCASNQDHTVVEPLIAPEGAKVGEAVTFSGHDGKPEDVLNPKKKQLDKITPHLFTDDNGVATFKGVHFMTSAGPCTSSIVNASIK